MGSKPKTVKFWCPICSFCVRFRQGKDFSDERGLSFYYLKNGFLVFLNISEYLARYSIQMAPSITVRSWQSWKKPVLCMFGLLSTIIRGREWTDQESANHGKIVLTNENNWASIIRGVARTSARRLGHPARAGPFLDFCSLPHLNIWVDFISHFLTGFITCLERVHQRSRNLISWKFSQVDFLPSRTPETVPVAEISCYRHTKCMGTHKTFLRHLVSSYIS